MGYIERWARRIACSIARSSGKWLERSIRLVVGYVNHTYLVCERIGKVDGAGVLAQTFEFKTSQARLRDLHMANLLATHIIGVNYACGIIANIQVAIAKCEPGR